MDYFVEIFHKIYNFKNFRICFIGVTNTNYTSSNLIKTTSLTFKFNCQRINIEQKDL